MWIRLLVYLHHAPPLSTSQLVNIKETYLSYTSLPLKNNKYKLSRSGVRIFSLRGVRDFLFKRTLFSLWESFLLCEGPIWGLSPHTPPPFPFTKISAGPMVTSTSTVYITKRNEITVLSHSNNLVTGLPTLTHMA